VEAQACGTPVVALDEGGARETVVHGVTGQLVRRADATLFADAIVQTLEMPLDRTVIRQHAERFSTSQFTTRFAAAVDETLEPTVAAS